VRIGQEVGAGRAGSLRIACVETMTVWLLVPVLRRWRRQRPDVRLELREFTSADRMVEHLAGGGADLAVGPEPTRTSEYAEVLGQEEMVVVASGNHPFVERPSVTMAEVAEEPFVHYDPGNGMAVWVDRFAARNQVSVTPVLRTGSPRTAAQLAGAGMGVAIVPASALSVRPSGVVRRLEPRTHRDILAVVAAPTDLLARRFVADLHRRGLPKADIGAQWAGDAPGPNTGH
jgi:DNA-binding transcriptional LysR family regulator